MRISHLLVAATLVGIGSLPVLAGDTQLRLEAPKSIGRSFAVSQPARKFTLANPTKLTKAPESELTVITEPPVRITLPPGANLLMNDRTCYTMRTYQVSRIDNSDSTEVSGYSTCMPGRRAQMKNAVGRRK